MHFLFVRRGLSSAASQPGGTSSSQSILTNFMRNQPLSFYCWYLALSRLVRTSDRSFSDSGFLEPYISIIYCSLKRRKIVKVSAGFFVSYFLPSATAAWFLRNNPNTTVGKNLKENCGCKMLVLKGLFPGSNLLSPG